HPFPRPRQLNKSSHFPRSALAVHPCGKTRPYDSHSPRQRFFRFRFGETGHAKPPVRQTVPGDLHMTNGNGTPPEAALPPQLNVLAQYTKDLSFENPNAPASLAPQQQQPAIHIHINLNGNNVAENDYE